MSEKRITFVRFGLLERVEHIFMLLSFTLLALTGLPQKFSDWHISLVLIRAAGGIENIRSIHHLSAIVLIILTIFHLIYVAYKIYVLHRPLTMLPGIKDVQDALQMMAYNIGLSKNRPAMDRYNFGEKVEYWAVVWGTLIMALTGYMLWNPILTTKILPGEFIPAAKAAHGAEAILAVLSILTWHFYHVHFKYFNKSMFTGRISFHEMEEEHAAELQKVLAGEERPLPPPEVVWRRSRVFIPAASIFALAALIFTYRFFTLEQTAITTVPPQQVAKVYAPIRRPALATATPAPALVRFIPERLPLPTPIPPEITSHPLDDLRQDCQACHGIYSYIAPAPLDHADMGLETCQDCHPLSQEVAKQ
ncbi:MAG: hypothetical protein GXP38_12645 [Chloroflexi bacterium]|nr:hypothetical protein [Chloroflexota bacterium]